MGLTPNNITFNQIMLNSFGSLIAGIVGSIFIIIATFMLSNVVNITETFDTANKIANETSAIFPLILSIITLIGTTITIYITYRLLHTTSDGIYKRNIIITGQILFFVFLTYLFLAPMYIYVGLIHYKYIIQIFLLHTIVVIFGVNIIIEILNKYRHILIGIYGSFVGLFISIISTIFIFSSMTSGTAKLMSLLFLLPLINFLMTFCKHLFEMIYFYYYKYTNLDQIGDIFYQIEMEEKEQIREEFEKNNI